MMTDSDASKGKRGRMSESNVIAFPEPCYFGDCSKCRRNDDYLNVGAEHWYICHKHKVKWCVGVNVFSRWRSEDERLWAKNSVLLSTYQTVVPYDSFMAFDERRELAVTHSDG
jgi:hypothetical protein